MEDDFISKVSKIRQTKAQINADKISNKNKKFDIELRQAMLDFYSPEDDNKIGVHEVDTKHRSEKFVETAQEDKIFGSYFDRDET